MTAVGVHIDIKKIRDWCTDRLLFACLHIHSPNLPMRISKEQFSAVGHPLYKSPEAYGDLTEAIVKTAIEVCAGRIISVLEGGYNLVALATATETHLKALVE